MTVILLERILSTALRVLLESMELRSMLCILFKAAQPEKMVK